MRFLANENIPLLVVRALNARGCDIVSAVEECHAAADEHVLECATRDGRIIITFDKDYGELVFRRRLPAPAGVVLLRFPPRSVEYIAGRLSAVLAGGIPLEGRFTVVADTRVRSVPIRPA